MESFLRAAAVRRSDVRSANLPARCGSDSWRTTSWLDSLGVIAQIASVLLGDVSPATDELAAMRALSSAASSSSELADRLRAGGAVEALAATIWPALQELSTAQPATGAELHGRFVQDGAAFTMRYGDLSTFFGGLEAKIGAPSPNVHLTMEEEHVAASDSRDEFTTSNYEVTTTPEIEWRFVVVATDRRLPDVEWPTEQKLRGTPGKMRRPMPLGTLRERLDHVNRQLMATGEPPLMLEEGFAARLYTGPMYVKYNDLLRGFGPALAGCKDNRYVTTSHAINSAIVKSSKLTSAQCVYRGVAGGILPEGFWVPNAQGVRGGIEGAFLSTTFDRSVAMHYASVPGKPAIVFELQMGMIDRGAELGWISQYPHERECLWAPLTGLEVQRSRVEGDVLIIEARPTINLNALTLEQVVSKRRKIVRDMADQLVLRATAVAAREPTWAELRANMPALSVTVASCLRSALDVLSGREPEHYNDDERLGESIRRAVDSAMGVSGWAAGIRAVVPPTGNAGGTLDGLLTREAVNWSYLSSGKRFGLHAGQAAGCVLALSPRIRTLDLFDANLTDKAAIALSDGLRTNTSLLSLRLGRNPIGAAGAAALASALWDHRTLAVLLLDRCQIGEEGGAAIAALLERQVRAGRPSRLTSINVLANGIGADAAARLVAVFTEQPQLRSLCGIEADQSELELLRKGLDSSDACLLAHDVCRNRSVQSLNLFKNDLGPDGAVALGIALEQGQSGLTSLNLSLNKIGTRGGEALAQALGTNSTLTTLNLANNELGADAASHLATALAHNTALRTLRLTQNDFGAAAELLSEAKARRATPLELVIADEMDAWMKEHEVDLGSLGLDLTSVDITGSAGAERAAVAGGGLAGLEVELVPE